MNILIIGGSAQSTPWLLSYLAQQSLPTRLNITLLGRSRRKVEAVVRAGKVLCKSPRVNLIGTKLENRLSRRLLEAADIVLIQIRVGGYAGRAFDETFPLQHEVCGDEGLGPGGLSAAWRNWPVIRRLLLQIRQIRPQARVLVLTSPVSLLVRAAQDTFPDLSLAGICELPWTTLLEVCGALDVPPGKVSFEYMGVNHLGWLFCVRHRSRDLVREYAKVRKDALPFPSHRVIESTGGIPLKCLRLHFCTKEVLAEQQGCDTTRGDELDALSISAFPAYRNGARREIESVLKMRAAPWYRHAVGPFILGLGGQKMTIPFFLSVRNKGSIPGFHDDDILECAHTVSEGTVKRSPQRSAVPPAMLEMTKKFVAYERLASSAIRGRSQMKLATALAAHPWVCDTAKAKEMASKIVRYDGSTITPGLC